MATREYPPYTIGGVATHTYHLTQALRKLSVDVHVVSFGNPARSNSRVTFIAPRSAIIKKSSPRIGESLTVLYDTIRFTKIVNAMIRREGYDIIHVQEPYVGGFVKAKTKVTTIHDTSYGELQSIFASTTRGRDIKKIGFYIGMGFLAEYASLATSRVIIAPSYQVKDELVKIYHFAEDKVVVIMNGVDPSNKYLSISKEEAKQRLGMEPSKIFVFTSAQHVARKRLDIFLAALKILERRGVLNRIEVMIGGDGPLRPALEDMAIKLNIREKIGFLGWLSRDSLELHYRAADIFVISSDYEAGPITMLEAMVAEAAIVSTNIPGFPSLAKDHIEALLVPPRNSRALANAIQMLIENESLRKTLATNGRRFALRYTWDKIAERTLSIYRLVQKS